MQMPTWEERVFAPGSYSGFTKQAQLFDILIIACTCVALLPCVVALCLLVVYRQARVLRMASPWISGLVVLGCMLMLLSNFGLSSLPTNAACAAHVWLLTLGFTLTFAPLVAKTFRIW